MKNIAIFGVSRSGKSTLAKMLCRKYSNYHMLIGDAIRNAFTQVLPQNNINSDETSSGMLEDFPNFLANLFYGSIKKSDGEFNYIIDTCDISPQKAKELFGKDNTLIVFLGFPNQTEQEHLFQIKKYENESDWTYTDKNATEEYMQKHAKRCVLKSKEFEKECKKLHLLFIDTSFDRESVLNHAIKEIETLIL